MEVVVKVAVVACLAQAALALQPQHDALEKRIQLLEERYMHEIASLKQEYGEQLSELGQRVASIEAANEQLARENDLLKARVDNNQCCEDEEQEHTVGDSNEINTTPGKAATHRQAVYAKTRLGSGVLKETIGQHIGHKRAMLEASNVAFTAYLDHDLNNQGANQILVYDKVLLNHGDGYNNITGVFTAPIPGVFSFSFSIGQRDSNQFVAQLMVNNQVMLAGIVETLHTHQDLQGGNTANLMLSRGDSVFIRHTGIGNHVEGNDNWRLTSFSGFLIYPVETSSEIIGK